MGNAQIKVGYFIFHKAFQAGRGTIFHEIMYFLDGNVQFPEQEDCFQNGALIIVIAAVSVFGIDGGGLKQSDFIIPHQCFFIDSMHGGKLADCKKFVCFIHNKSTVSNL